MARININSESSSDGLFDTEIPDFSDNADIQEALRMYHYGAVGGTTIIPTTSAEVSGGIAGYLKNISEDIAFLEEQGIGSAYLPSAPSGKPSGYIWVNSSSAGQAQSFASRTVYQNNAPTDGLFDGMLWVDKDSSPLTMYVYDATSSTWKEIGA
jgi:hypothetical protein